MLSQYDPVLFPWRYYFFIEDSYMSSLRLKISQRLNSPYSSETVEVFAGDVVHQCFLNLTGNY